jgi:uncharacterized protein YcfJ
LGSRSTAAEKLFGRFLMKAKALAVAAIVGVAALGSWSPPANAAGCLKGAIIGGLAGHFAGHGLLGAGAGCVVGRHYANRTVRQDMRPTQTRTATRDDDTTTNRPNTRTVTRDAYTVPVMRHQSEEIGYGSSMPDRRR